MENKKKEKSIPDDEFDKLIKRKKDEAKALRKMLQNLKSQNNNLKNK